MSTTPDLPPAEHTDILVTPPLVPELHRHPEPGEPLLKRIINSNGMVSVLAILLSLLVGAILIAFTDERVTSTASYFFSRPSDMLNAVWISVSEAYIALFQSSIINTSAESISDAIYPLTETLTIATPLVLAGLGVALAFRVGLFNIGAQGQIILGATFAGWVGFNLDLPVGIHLVVAVVAGIVGGALWGGIAGFLKARRGAHEVIVTIMLNYIAVYLLLYLLSTPTFQREGSNNPLSDPVAEFAAYPLIFGPAFRLHYGFLVALAAVAFTWWLLNRSTTGFEMRAVGANPVAAKTAGINVGRAYLLAMLIAGGLAGLAGTAQILGTERSLSGGIAASFGFDAITVALLGRSNPIGTLFAGLLFGALRAGGVGMQANTGIPIDIVLVVQSFIVLFIAAPPLVRSIFRIGTSKPKNKKAAAPAATGGAA
ncbi:ABC transporter permease [Paeniglutamicibacter kerguelensis]|uniref:Simple sugar transport system permease protein n=1 Tax=Paeniglutamicibacter kerguelensis TaxID=254788 RepID=A0ABS4X8T3_9MICC|nr:ABC transporter permease [Paeniglutamicibacter kerguelensis]MBP2384874.1 simple sugar transport system permease protein [Paeniglutamicibacter kerguelensis]